MCRDTFDDGIMMPSSWALELLEGRGIDAVFIGL